MKFRTAALSLLLSVCLAPAIGNCQKALHGWQRSGAKYDRELIGELKAAITDNTYKKINGIVVIKNGKLLIEEYFNGENRDSLHDPRSVGKTFASAILGIALRDGYIKTLDEPLSDFYDLKLYENYSDRKGKVTLRQFLTMSSAFDGDDNVNNSPGNEENMYPQPNWVDWALSLPVDERRKPGQDWHYFTAGAMLLGDILDRRVPGGLEKYSDKKLFRPLGIGHREWVYTPQHGPSTAGGFRLSALDFAKFGQLYEDGGTWNGTRVIPKSWVAASFHKYLQTSFPGDSYGYLWWNKKFEVGGKSYETYYCSGNGGNKIFVFTDQPLVVVVTASAYNTKYMHSQVDEMMTKYILPAIVAEDLPK
ncbi:MAG: serine hydrolase [Acidobacteriota bacterium]